MPDTEDEIVEALSLGTPAYKRMDLVGELGNLNVHLSRPIVENILVWVLNKDPNAIVRHEAAFVLGRLHRGSKPLSITSVGVLCETALHDPSGVVRHEAAESLGCIPDPRVRKVLEQLLFDISEDVVETARIGLERHDLA